MPGRRNVKKTLRSKSITAGALLNTAVTCKVYIAIRGDTEARRHGERETRGRGDAGRGRRGTGRRGDTGTERRGDGETRRHGNAGKTSPRLPFAASPPLFFVSPLLRVSAPVFVS